MLRCRIADLLFLIAVWSHAVSGQSRGAVPRYIRQFPKDTIITITNKTKDCQNIAEFHLPIEKGFVPKSVLNRINGNLDRYYVDIPFYFDGNAVKCSPHINNHQIYNLTLEFEQGAFVWKEFLNIEVEDSGLNSQLVLKDRQSNTPVRFVNHTRSEKGLLDETSHFPPIQTDETSNSPQIQLDEALKSHPIPSNETSQSQPIQLDESLNSPFIQVNETLISQPIELDETLKYPPIVFNVTPRSPPIQFDETSKSPPIPFNETSSSPPIQFDETPISPPIQLHETPNSSPDFSVPSLTVIVPRDIYETGPEFLPPLMAGGVLKMEINEDTPEMMSLLPIGFHDNDTATSDLTLRITDMSPRVNDGMPLFILKDNTLYTAPNVGRHLDVDNVETRPLRFTIQLRVDDGTLSSTTAVEIEIKDVNDNLPLFENTEMSKHVLDTTPIAHGVKNTFSYKHTDLNQNIALTLIMLGTSIFHFRAWDADRTSPNNKVTYSIKGKGSSDFHLDPSTGELRVSAGLDYGRQPLYKLVVTARDGGVYVPRSNSISVNITVDTAPKFIRPPHPETGIFRDENLMSKMVLFVLDAVDLDGIDKGTSVRYSIDAIEPQYATALFVISRNVLQLTIHASQDTFDVDKNATDSLYSFILSVTDGTYTTRTSLWLKIFDANDNPPVFTKPAYSVTMLDTFRTGDEIIRVTATDNDRTHPNNAIDYSLDGPGSRHFTINANNGSILITSPLRLDKGSTVKYNLKVTATDKGEPRNSVTVPLTIIINAPSVLSTTTSDAGSVPLTTTSDTRADCIPTNDAGSVPLTKTNGTGADGTPTNDAGSVSLTTTSDTSADGTPTNDADSVPLTTTSGTSADGTDAMTADAVSDSPSKELPVMLVLTPFITVVILLAAVGAVALVWYHKIRRKKTARRSRSPRRSTMPMKMPRLAADDAFSYPFYGSPLYCSSNSDIPLFDSSPLYGSLWPNMPLQHGAYSSWMQNAYGHQQPFWYYKDTFFWKPTSLLNSFSSSEDDILKNPY